jgi:hypothetical protein
MRCGGAGTGGKHSYRHVLFPGFGRGPDNKGTRCGLIDGTLRQPPVDLAIAQPSVSGFVSSSYAESLLGELHEDSIGPVDHSCVISRTPFLV